MSTSEQRSGQRIVSIEEVFYLVMAQSRQRARKKKKKRTRSKPKPQPCGISAQGYPIFRTLFDAIDNRQGDFFEPLTDMPSSATTAKAGTAEKIKALRERAENGEPLWHPNDPVIKHTMSRPDRSEACRESSITPLVFCRYW